MHNNNIVEAPPPSPKFTKQIINGYVFLDVIGKGSFGEVYKAEKENHIFAIKTIDKEIVKKKKLAKYVKNEISIQKQLDSQHIVKLFEHFEDSTFLFIVLEYCNEGTLFHYVVKSKPGYDECMKIFV